MLPLLAVCTSCEKNKGTDNVDDSITEDGIILFNDPKFMEALLCVQEDYEVFDFTTGDMRLHTIDIDKNKDGQISVTEAEAAEGMVLWNTSTYEQFNIEDVAEIRYFTSLRFLDCIENQITELDVSNSKELEYLDCYWNKLTSLVIGDNAALRFIDCSGNVLATLDVSKCKSLFYFDCSNNQLTSLNLSGCESMMYFDCYHNQLTSLDLSACTSLTYLECSENPLTSLDVSNNLALQEVGCYDTALESITISASQQNAVWLQELKLQYPDLEVIVK